MPNKKLKHLFNAKEAAQIKLLKIEMEYFPKELEDITCLEKECISILDFANSADSISGVVSVEQLINGTHKVFVRGSENINKIEVINSYLYRTKQKAFHKIFKNMKTIENRIFDRLIASSIHDGLINKDYIQQFKNIVRSSQDDINNIFFDKKSI